MKRKNVTVVSAFILSAAFILTGCAKFDEGGQISKAEKNIANTWELDQYLRNGNDETSTIQISNYEETYTEEGVYSRSYNEVDGDLVTESGVYNFSEDKELLHISGISSIDDFSPEHSTLSSSTYHILKLTGDEYWYSYENGGDLHEFRFVVK